MEASTEMYSADDFWVRVREGEGHRPAGEVYAMQQIAQPTIAVLFFEGPHGRREPPRPTANPMMHDEPCLRHACRAASR